jgi:rfaE bifunctional protein kinase chain/domain
LIIGDVMLDNYLWGEVHRISPEAPVPIVAVTQKDSRLGGAANVALNIKAMGANPILCSVVGADENSALFKSLLKEQKLSSKGILRDKNRITTTKTRIIGNKHQMLRVDEETLHPLNQEQTKKLVAMVSVILGEQKIDVIIFEDYDKGVITADLIEQVVALAKKKGIPTAVDPKKNNFLFYKNVTLFKPNFRELKEGLSLEFDAKDAKKLIKADKQLRAKLGNAITLITLSEAGVYVSDAKIDHFIPAHLRNISDVSGAGDTVIAIAALCLGMQTSAEFLAALANIAGGLVCEKIGVVSIDKEQLKQEAVNKLAGTKI